MAKGEYCPAPYGYLHRLKDGVIKPCPCNKLTCEVCGKRKKNQLLDDISYGVDQIKAKGGQLKFMTFTTSYQSEQAKFGKYLHRFMMALRYYGIVNPEYVWLPEKTKSDLIHCHMLINVGWLDKDEIKDLWWKCTDETAWHCSIDHVKLRSPAGYMSKYLTKNLADRNFKKGTRRYNFSRNWPRLEKFKSEDRWEFLPPGVYAHVDDPDRIKNFALKLAKSAGIEPIEKAVIFEKSPVFEEKPVVVDWPEMRKIKQRVDDEQRKFNERLKDLIK